MMPAHSPLKADRVQFHQCTTAPADLLTELLIGLKQTPKRIHPKFFYDRRGSQLFEQITRLPEYYPTRAETEILRRYAHVIAGYVGPDSILLEPGSGSGEKIALLLDALRPALYVPIDIAAAHLRDAAERLAAEFPWLSCQAVAADFSEGVQLPIALPPGRRVVFYPGSSIGNFDPPAAVDFLRQLAALVGTGGGLLVGVDLQKDSETLRRAYADRQGVTAAFNRNILRHVNDLAGANFSVEAFDHVAFYNEDQRRVEMHLECRYTHDVLLGGQPIHIRAGERIHTENSYKYTTNSFTALAARAGFRRERTWYDDREQFSFHYLIADGAPVFIEPHADEAWWEHQGLKPAQRPQTVPDSNPRQ